MGCKQGAIAPKGTWGPLIFISKFKFLKYKQSIGKVRKKSQCRFYFRGMTLKADQTVKFDYRISTVIIKVIASH